MKIVVPIQLVPDLVEELVIDPGGDRLDPMSVRWVVNEFDDYAIEQAVLLKERGGGQVNLFAPDLEGADDVLFAGAAKGADVLVKLSGDFEQDFNIHALARLYAPLIKAAQPDLVLTGVMAHNSSDGALGAVLAGELGLPYVGYVSGVNVSGGKAVVRKEYPGGQLTEMEVILPAVLGVLSPDTPPRYVPISKIRQVMKTARIQEEDAGAFDVDGGFATARMFLPESTSKATMLAGDVDEVAAQLVSILKEQGLL